jgi:hypothetical protein
MLSGLKKQFYVRFRQIIDGFGLNFRVLLISSQIFQSQAMRVN